MAHRTITFISSSTVFILYTCILQLNFVIETYNMGVSLRPETHHNSYSRNVNVQ